MWEIILKTYYYDLFVFNYYTCQTAGTKLFLKNSNNNILNYI